MINSTISELVNVFGIQMQELENRNDHEFYTVCFCFVVESAFRYYLCFASLIRKCSLYKTCLGTNIEPGQFEILLSSFALRF